VLIFFIFNKAESPEWFIRLCQALASYFVFVAIQRFVIIMCCLVVLDCLRALDEKAKEAYRHFSSLKDDIQGRSEQYSKLMRTCRHVNSRAKHMINMLVCNSVRIYISWWYYWEHVPPEIGQSDKIVSALGRHFITFVLIVYAVYRMQNTNTLISKVAIQWRKAVQRSLCASKDSVEVHQLKDELIIVKEVSKFDQTPIKFWHISVDRENRLFIIAILGISISNLEYVIKVACESRFTAVSTALLGSNYFCSENFIGAGFLVYIFVTFILFYRSPR
jgi:hypothetical protein